MDYREAKILLDKFYDGHTTCQEEQSLYEWLCSDECPEELFTDRKVVRAYIRKYSAAVIPDELEFKMEQFIDQWATVEDHPIHKLLYFKWKRIAGIAALIALVVAGAATYFYPSDKGVYVDTCQTPEEAYMEVQKVLSLASETIQKGMEPLIYD